MSNLSDRISYLRGLAEGLKVDESSSEGKLITQLIDVLSEVIDEVDDLHDEVDELNDYVESIDEDLSELEDDYDDDEDEDFDFELEDDDEDDEDEDLDDDDEDDEFDFFAREDDLDEDGVGMYVGCICPECHGMFCIDARIDEDDLLYTCPHCSKNVEANPMDNDNVPIAKAAAQDDDTDE